MSSENKFWIHDHLTDDGKTIVNADGSKTYVYGHLTDDGQTIINPDGSKSHVYKDPSGDGYMIINADGSKSRMYKDLLGDGYTVANADGSRFHVHRNLLDDGYTAIQTESAAAPVTSAAPPAPAAKRTEASAKKPVQPRAKEYVYNAYPDDRELLAFVPQRSGYTGADAQAYALYAASLLLKACPSEFKTLTGEETLERERLSGPFGLRREKTQIKATVPENRGILLRRVQQNYIGGTSSVESEEHGEKVYLTCDGRIFCEKSVETDYYDGHFREEKSVSYGSLTNRATVRGDASVNLIAVLDLLLSEKKVPLSFDAWLAAGAEGAHKPDRGVLESAQAAFAAERAAALKAATAPDRSQMWNPYLPFIVLLALAVFPAIHLEHSQNRVLYYVFFACGLAAVFFIEREYYFAYLSTTILLIACIELAAFVGLTILLHLKTPWICAALILAILVLAIRSRAFEVQRSKGRK